MDYRWAALIITLALLGSAASAQQKATLPDDAKRLIPLTPAVFYILLALSSGAKHGYAIMQETNILSEDSFQMGPATLYSTIQRLVPFGAAASAGAPGGLACRLQAALKIAPAYSSPRSRPSIRSAQCRTGSHALNLCIGPSDVNGCGRRLQVFPAMQRTGGRCPC